MFKKMVVVSVGLLCTYSAFGEVSDKTVQGKVTIKNNVVFLNGKEVVPKIKGGEVAVEGSDALSIEENLKYKNGNAVLIMDFSRGTSCPAKYRWLIVMPDSTTQTPEFGSCSDLPKVSITGDKLTVMFPRFNSAPKSTVVFDGVSLTENGKPLK